MPTLVPADDLPGVTNGFTPVPKDDLPRGGSDPIAEIFGSDAPKARRVVQAESSGNPTAQNTNRNGTVDRGLFQINSIHIPQLQKEGIISTETDLFDPVKNTKAALYLKNRDGWKPWDASKAKWDNTEGTIPERQMRLVPADDLPEKEPTIVDAIKDSAKSDLGNAEALGSQATNMVFGLPIGGIAGLAKLITSGDPSAATKTIEEVSRALTYQPQTAAGQRSNEAVGQAFDTVIGKPVRAIADKGAQEAEKRALMLGFTPEEARQEGAVMGTVAEVAGNIGLPAAFGVRAKTVEPTPTLGTFLKKIADPKERVQFVKDLAEEVRVTKRPVEEILVEKVAPIEQKPTPVPIEELPEVKPVVESVVAEASKVPLPEVIPDHPIWKQVYELPTFDDRMAYLSNEAAKFDSPSAFAAHMGEAKGGKPSQAWIDFFGKESDLTTARKYWTQNHRINRKAVYDADPEFIAEETIPKLTKNIDADIIGIREELYEEGFSKEQVTRIIDGFTKASETQGKLADLGKIKAEIQAEIASVKPISAAPNELPGTPQDFSLSGSQPVKRAGTFTPPEIKGGRLFEAEKQTTDQLYDRLKKPSVVTGTLAEKPTQGGFIELDTPNGLINAVRRVWPNAKELWEPLSSLPAETRDWYLGERYRTLGKEAQVERIAKKVFDKTKDMSPEVKQGLFASLEDPAMIDALPSEQQGYARMLRQVNKIAGDMLVKRGQLAPEVVEAMQNKGGYVKYLYLKHVLGDDAMAGGSAGMNLSELKARKGMTREQQRAIGLIEDVSVAEPVGLGQSLGDTVKHDFFKAIAERPDIVWEPSVVEVEGQKWGMGKLQDEVKLQEQIAKQAPDVPEIQERLVNLKSTLYDAIAKMGEVPDDYLAIPNSPKYGPLAGSFIKKPIARDILPVMDFTISDPKKLGKIWNNAIKFEEKSMAAFKVGKTALNPPTAARNAGSGFIQLNMSGISFPDVFKYMKKSLMSALKKDANYGLARRNGLFKTNWGESEINEVLGTVRGMNGSMLGLWEKVGDIAKYYGKIDDFYKLAKFIEQRDNGVPVGKAVAEAHKWGMDYSLAPPAVKMARRHAVPFASYSSKIAPLIAESITKRPWVIAKYVAIPYAMAQVAKKTLNLTDNDWQKLQKELPLFIKKAGTYAVLPWKSPEGHAQWVNLEYFFPWQQVAAIGRDAYQGNVGELVGDLGLGNPLIDALYVARGAAGGEPPKDLFTHRPIYNQLDTPTDKAIKTSMWLFSKWAPTSLTPEGAAGYTQRAIKGDKDKYGRTVTPAQAAGRWVGINIVAPTPQQARKEIAAKERELSMSLGQITKDPTVSKEKKSEARERYLKKMRSLHQAANE